MKGDDNDPKGLIYEAYRMEELGKPECRSIFLDWALSLPVERDTNTAMRALLQEHKVANPGHPMNEVIEEGLSGLAAPRRRGGWRSRSRN